ncbi:MAG: signal peptidase I [Verrucomicrobia bacterium]|nr:signal peptidase I [Verrucomicrobiota bacterium]
MILQWFLSRAVRHATELRHQVSRLVNEQRDVLQGEAIAAIVEANEALRNTIRSGATKDALLAQMARVTEVANEKLMPYPRAAARENVKEFFVAATVILAFTTFFLQLTKIPTGSMQPTLYGITFEDLRNKPEVEIPNRLVRFARYWSQGISYYHVTAKSDGTIRDVNPPQRVFPFVKKQNFSIGDAPPERIWFPPDQLLERCGLQEGRHVRAGEDIVRLKVVAGDHLLVDRFTYNFRRPRRGEIIVFKTRGIPDLIQDQLYIKRLVALGGERVRIGNDQHLVIDGRRLDAATPGFESVYTFDPSPSRNHYFGHVNQLVADRWGGARVAPRFADESVEQRVGQGEYLAMGDNTLNSRDSRDWGGLPQENVIGKCWFVYWPFTERFGWGVR